MIQGHRLGCGTVPASVGFEASKFKTRSKFSWTISKFNKVELETVRECGKATRRTGSFRSAHGQTR